MIAPLVLMLLGGLVFVEQDVPGVRASSASSWVSLTSFTHADIDHDGYQDLVFLRDVALQRDGGFPSTARIPLPDYDPTPECDVWQGDLYLRSPGRLIVIHWDGTAWQTLLDQPLDWPDLGEHETSPALRPTEETRPHVHMNKFLHDFEGDDVPECVIAYKDGLHIYARTDGRYAQAACLDFLPQPEVHLSRRWSALLWPPEARRIGTPYKYFSGSFSVRGRQLTVVAEKFLPGHKRQYQVTTHQLDPTHGYAVLPDATKERLTEHEPSTWNRGRDSVMRLNEDEVLDLIVYSWERVETTPLGFGPRTCEVSISTDEGKTWYRQRAMAVAPQFVDFDRDGDLDLVCQDAGWLEGGMREAVTRVLTEKNVRNQLRVYLQDDSGRFSEEPVVRKEVAIQLDAAPMRRSRMCERYMNDELIDLRGDLNGDRFADLVVQDRPKRLAVYLSDGYRIPAASTATLPVPENAYFGVADVDGDGRSDIIIWGFSDEEGKWGADSRVFFSREETP